MSGIEKDLLASEIKSYLMSSGHLPYKPDRFGYIIRTYVFNFGEKMKTRPRYRGTIINVKPPKHGSIKVFVDHPVELKTLRDLDRMSDDASGQYSSKMSIWTRPQIDLVSAFIIYNRREDCSVSVIRHVVVNTFDAYVRDYQEKRDELTTKLFYFYMMNAYMFNGYSVTEDSTPG